MIAQEMKGQTLRRGYTIKGRSGPAGSLCRANKERPEGGGLIVWRCNGGVSGVLCGPRALLIF